VPAAYFFKQYRALAFKASYYTLFPYPKMIILHPASH